MRDKSEIEKQIEAIETQMNESTFWDDKDVAQAVIAKHQELKDELSGVGKYDKGDAVVTIFSGAGGDDAEDFSSILFRMYEKYIGNRNWILDILHENTNEMGGYRNITFEVNGSGAYGALKNESGVHRLVRISPFNSQGKRHTSFSMVEVTPKLPDLKEVEVLDDDLDVQFSKSSGPGGQNVNKRETAVRIVHKPTNISAHIDSERSQQQNKEKAMEVLKGKLFKKTEDDRRKKEKGLSISATVSVEWGSQIRSYVFHPYQMVKDHRTDMEVRDVDSVLGGDIQKFIDAEQNLE
ncbi:MAG: PCRF domain-containing protein [Parcubacteria group bacterium]|nr:PCRF domain-containing protein [Parcubacteria group bacterium]